jgi:hypothetical protein
MLIFGLLERLGGSGRFCEDFLNKRFPLIISSARANEARGFAGCFEENGITPRRLGKKIGSWKFFDFFQNSFDLDNDPVSTNFDYQ